MNFILKNILEILLCVFISIILFHIFIILKIIPYHIAWGGRLKNDVEMYVFEFISIFINVFISWILVMKGNIVKCKFSDKTLNIILWIFFAIFILNTIANIFAQTIFEKTFAFLTGIIAILLWKVLRK